jgi:hypothetical protein
MLNVNDMLSELGELRFDDWGYQSLLNLSRHVHLEMESYIKVKKHYQDMKDSVDKAQGDTAYLLALSPVITKLHALKCLQALISGIVYYV